jgi:NAD(P)-dependent dehydrogenase (short-subunit alcohol dehydrogenase family)
MELNDKTVLVTGGTSGIGRATAEAFGAAGAEVIVTGRDETRGAEVVAGIEAAGGSGRFVQADLGNPADVAGLAAASGDVDILVNNAGVFTFAPSHETSSEELRRMFEVNVFAPFVLTAAIAPAMAARGHGAIVNVSTMVAAFGLPGMSAYGSSKAALELLTKSWAAEYGPQGVRVNAVAPGPTRTPGTEPMGDALDALATTLPLGRPAEVAEIASAIVFLASDAAAYISGAIVPVDGGRRAV